MDRFADVVDLTSVRADREAAREAAMALHPALRWVAGDVWYLAHRKDRTSRPACGADGDLFLAPPGVPLCGDCFERGA